MTGHWILYRHVVQSVKSRSVHSVKTSPHRKGVKEWINRSDATTGEKQRVISPKWQRLPAERTLLSLTLKDRESLDKQDNLFSRARRKASYDTDTLEERAQVEVADVLMQKRRVDEIIVDPKQWRKRRRQGCPDKLVCNDPDRAECVHQSRWCERWRPEPFPI